MKDCNRSTPMYDRTFTTFNLPLSKMSSTPNSTTNAKTDPKGSFDADKQRQQRVKHDTQLRKAKREGEMAAKRVVLEDQEQNEAESMEFALERILPLVDMMQHGEEKTEALRALRRLFACGSLYIEAFVMQDKAVDSLLALLLQSSTQLDVRWLKYSSTSASARTKRIAPVVDSA